jgi:hypothetical protein
MNSRLTTPALDLNGAENSATLIESMTAAQVLPVTNLANHTDYAH